MGKIKVAPFSYVPEHTDMTVQSMVSWGRNNKASVMIHLDEMQQDIPEVRLTPASSVLYKPASSVIPMHLWQQQK